MKMKERWKGALIHNSQKVKCTECANKQTILKFISGGMTAR